MNTPQLAVKLRSFFGFSPRIFFKSDIPIISCSTGNIGNNGALTAITALQATYLGGAWVNLPAGAIAAGIPAVQTSYWSVWTTAQAATVYNIIQPTTGFPTPPTAAQIAAAGFVTTGPGAFTGITAATVFLTVPLPGGLLGANGKLRISVSLTNTNSGGTKIFTALVSTARAISNQNSTNVYSGVSGIFANVNAQNINKAYTMVAAAAGTVYSAIDTSIAQNITFNITDNTATDNSVLEGVLIELLSDGT